MGFTKKTWKNRIAEYINRRLITMEDGSTNLVTVARDEGTISQEGDAFNAVNMNDLEDRIEAGFEDVSQSLTNINTVWKLIGSATAKNKIEFDASEYKELYIAVRPYAAGCNCCIQIPTVMLNDTVGRFICTSVSNMSAIVDVTDSYACIYYAQTNSGDFTSDSRTSIKVYGR